MINWTDITAGIRGPAAGSLGDGEDFRYLVTEVPGTREGQRIAEMYEAVQAGLAAHPAAPAVTHLYLPIGREGWTFSADEVRAGGDQGRALLPLPPVLG